MSDKAPIDHDQEFWRLYYAWDILLPEEQPSADLVAGVWNTSDSFAYYRANICGYEGTHEWPTSSWVEVAFSTVTGAYRVLWKSGIGDTQELPGAILSEWGTAKDADDAIEQFFNRMEKAGTPVVGVCRTERVASSAGFRERPVIHGYDFGAAQ